MSEQKTVDPMEVALARLGVVTAVALFMGQAEEVRNRLANEVMESVGAEGVQARVQEIIAVLGYDIEASVETEIGIGQYL